MARTFAVINGGNVVNVILADEWPDGVDITDMNPKPGIGWAYDGQTFTAPPPVIPPQVLITDIQQAQLLARMTPIELHGWYRAFQRAAATNSPTATDRNAMYAWLRWENMDGKVSLTDDEIIGLAQVWIALGMTQQRAEEILTPLIQE